MGRWVSCIIVIFHLGLGFRSLAHAQEELPFWRTKPKLEKQITEQRKVVVSVDADTKGRESTIKMLGVGVVNVPMEFAIEHILNFEELTSVSSYFKKVKHDREKQEVYFFIQALGKQIRFIQKYKWGTKTSDEAQLDWIVTWGMLEGMVGHYKLRKISPMKTEIALWASMKKLDIPLPEFLINFTLEVIAEKTAQKMRAFLEEKLHESQKQQKKK